MTNLILEKDTKSLVIKIMAQHDRLLKDPSKTRASNDPDVFKFIVDEYASYASASECRKRTLERYGKERTPAIQTFYDWRIRYVVNIMVRREELASQKFKILSKQGIFGYLQQIVDDALNGNPIIHKETGEELGRTKDLKSAVAALKLANDMQSAKGADILSDEAGNERAKIRMIVRGTFQEMKSDPVNEGRPVEELVAELVRMLPPAEQYAEELIQSEHELLALATSQQTEDEK